jgi:hypothetical protein
MRQATINMIRANLVMLCGHHHRRVHDGDCVGPNGCDY